MHSDYDLYMIRLARPEDNDNFAALNMWTRRGMDENDAAHFVYYQHVLRETGRLSNFERNHLLEIRQRYSSILGGGQ